MPDGKHARVPCPVDPNHTVRASQLDRHIANCGSDRAMRSMKSQPYYKDNINSGTVPVEATPLISIREALVSYWHEQTFLF